jgi:hypothetical protein
MPEAEAPLVYGWRSCAARAGVSERYVRQLARERGLVVDRRGDGAVGIAAAALDDLAVELRAVAGSAARNHKADQCPAAPLNSNGTGSTSSPEASTGGHTSSAPPPLHASAAPPGKVVPPADDGPLAAAVFRELGLGKSLRDIVVTLEVTPEVAREMHRRWNALAAADALATEDAEARLARLEAVLDDHQARFDRIDIFDEERYGSLLHRLDVVSQRLAGLEQRFATDGTRQLARSLVDRVAALETQMKALPSEMIAIGVLCPTCGGGPVLIPAACLRCHHGVKSSVSSAHPRLP